MADYKLPVITGTSLSEGDLLRWNSSAWVNYPDSNYGGSLWTRADTTLSPATANDSINLGSGTATLAGITIANNGTIGQAAGPLLTFDDTNNFLEITGCKVGILTTAPQAALHINSSLSLLFQRVGGIANKQVYRWSLTANAFSLQALNDSFGWVRTIYYMEHDGNIGFGVVPKTKLTVAGTLTLKEQAAADGDTDAYGQLWVKNDAPNTLWFTNDIGTDLRIAPQDLQTTASPQFAELGVGTTSGAATVDIRQGAGDGAIPALKIQQIDFSEEFIHFVGSSTQGVLSNNIVKETDVTTATRAGFLEVYVDDNANRVTDGAYYIPLFGLE